MSNRDNFNQTHNKAKPNKIFDWTVNVFISLIPLTYHLVLAFLYHIGKNKADSIKCLSIAYEFMDNGSFLWVALGVVLLTFYTAEGIPKDKRIKFVLWFIVIFLIVLFLVNMSSPFGGKVMFWISVVGGTLLLLISLVLTYMTIVDD